MTDITINEINKEIHLNGFDLNKYTDDFLYDLVSKKCDFEVFKLYYSLYIDHKVDFNPEIVTDKISDENDIEKFLWYIQVEEIIGWINHNKNILDDDQIEILIEKYDIPQDRINTFK